MEENQNHVFGSVLVVKFGGSSLANGEKVSNAVKAVIKELKKGAKIAVVVSAMGKTTDFLLEVVREATSCGKTKPCNTDIDDVLAMGERTSARIFSAIIKANSVRCRYFDPSDSDWPIITNNVPMNADPILEICEERIRKHVLPLLNEGVVTVIPGFIGKTLDGKITTMGRGGSDITALVLARALKAKQVILVTDVDGIMTADPKLVKNARKLSEIDVNSLIGLTSSSHKFLQRKALKYKEDWLDVKIINHNHCDLNAEGTIIRGSLVRNIVNIDFPDPVAAITIVGKGISQSTEILHQVIQKMKSVEAHLLGFSANYDSLILYVLEDALNKVLEPLHSVVQSRSEAIAMAVRKNLTLIKIRVAELEGIPRILGNLTKALSAKGISIYGLFTVTSGIQFLVDIEHAKDAFMITSKCLEEDYELPLEFQITEVK